MQRTTTLLLVFGLMLSGCATQIPVAVDCAPPPPVPQVLTEPASTPPNLMQRYNTLITEFSKSLSEAVKQP